MTLSKNDCEHNKDKLWHRTNLDGSICSSFKTNMLEVLPISKLKKKKQQKKIKLSAKNIIDVKMISYPRTAWIKRLSSIASDPSIIERRSIRLVGS